MNRILQATIVMILFGLSACTISPKAVESTSPSYSGNTMNSGIVLCLPAGGFVVDNTFRAAYVALCEKYKFDFPTANVGDLKPIPNGYWYCYDETMADYLAMNKLNRSGFVPTKK